MEEVGENRGKEAGGRSGGGQWRETKRKGPAKKTSKLIAGRQARRGRGRWLVGVRQASSHALRSYDHKHTNHCVSCTE